MTKMTNTTNPPGRSHARAVGFALRLLMLPALLSWSATLPGCAATQDVGMTDPPPSEQRSAADPRTAPVILNGRTGARTPHASLVRAALRSDVVFVGETHGHPLGLAFAQALWQDLLSSARAGRAALSMEFLERDAQVAIDDYITGLHDEEALVAALDGLGMKLPEAHMSMVRAAGDAGARVYAANAPRRYVRAARLQGYDRLTDLTEAQRRLFNVPAALPNGRYREDFEAVMRPMFQGRTHGEESRRETGHGGGDAIDSQLEGFFRAQVLWDATMAETVARALASGRRPVLHIVGRFHTDFAGATAHMLRERRLGARIMTISVIDAAGPELSSEDRGRADFVVYVGETDESADAMASR